MSTIHIPTIVELYNRWFAAACPSHPTAGPYHYLLKEMKEFVLEEKRLFVTHVRGNSQTAIQAKLCYPISGTGLTVTYKREDGYAKRVEIYLRGHKHYFGPYDSAGLKELLGPYN